MTSIHQTIAAELKIPAAQVTATVALLDDGNTIPFIARCRKEVTGGLDEVQIREIQARLAYLRKLTERKEAVRAEIESQGVLTAEEDGSLKVRVETPDGDIVGDVAGLWVKSPRGPGAAQVRLAVEDGYSRLLRPEAPSPRPRGRGLRASMCDFCPNAS